VNSKKTDVQSKMQVELENYLQKRVDFKNYSQSMKELTTWLEEKVKK